MRVGGAWWGWMGFGRGDGGGDGAGSLLDGATGRSETEKDLRFLPARPGDWGRSVRFDI